MEAGNTLMKINNRTLRILKKWTGNMRMIDAAIATKGLLRKLLVLLWRMRRAMKHISNPRASMSLVRKQLEAANFIQRQVPCLAFCKNDLNAIFFESFQKMDFQNLRILFFPNNMSTSKQKQRTNQTKHTVNKKTTHTFLLQF